MWKVVTFVLSLQLPTLLVGDFNCTLEAKEKKSGKPFKVNREIQKFQSFIQQIDLLDLGYQGPSHTWCNNRHGLARVWKRLDHTFASDRLLDLFLETIVTHLTRFASDHYLLLIHLSDTKPSRPMLFRLEKM